MAERLTEAEIERACEVMHDAYEAAATETGWETQERSRKPWVDVPEANKVTMRAAVRALLTDRAARTPTEDAATKCADENCHGECEPCPAPSAPIPSEALAVSEDALVEALGPELHRHYCGTSLDLPMPDHPRHEGYKCWSVAVCLAAVLARLTPTPTDADGGVEFLQQRLAVRWKCDHEFKGATCSPCFENINVASVLLRDILVSHVPTPTGDALASLGGGTDAAGTEGAKCTCPYTDPSTWLSAASCGYGGGYEPGSMQEWDPDCPVHLPAAAAPEENKR